MRSHRFILHDQIYFSLYRKYKNDLTDSRTEKAWERLLHIMDSTTITLIANLLLSVIRKRIRRKWSFSNFVTIIRQTLVYYIGLYIFCENPEKAWLRIIMMIILLLQKFPLFR